MKKTIALLACAAAGVGAMADTGQQVTVGGEALGKFVTSIAFDGDDVVLTLEDNTTITAPMDGVAVSLDYRGVTDGIVRPAAGPRAAGVYTISGQYVGTSLDNLQKGIYIVNGKKVIKK